MTIAKGHSGNFTQGDVGDTYTLTVTNAGNHASSGTVTVVDTLPSGLTATNIDGGTGWSCTLATLTCTRSDALAGSYQLPGHHVDGERGRQCGGDGDQQRNGIGRWRDQHGQRQRQ